MIPLAAFRALAVAVLCGGMGLLAHVALCSPSRRPGVLGIRGLKRQRALQDTAWRRFEPLVRWVGHRVSGIPSDKQNEAIDRQLVLAGDYLGLTPAEYVALNVLSSIGGVGAAIGLGRFLKASPVMMAAAMLFVAAIPYLLVSGEIVKRQKWVARRLPGAIDLIALAMSAGLDFPGAVRQVVDKSSDPYDPLIEELGFVLHKLGLGRTRRQALEEFAGRVPVEVVLEFVGAVAQAEERGHPVAGVLQIQATQSRQRRSVRAEENAAKAGVALALPLILVFISILILILAPIILRVGHSALFEG